MTVTHSLRLDLDQKPGLPPVPVVLGDSLSRALALSLQCGGQDWPIPEGTRAIVRYRKSDGTAGVYDTLPDGTAACGISGNLLTCILAPQVCTAVGPVQLAVSLVQGPATLSTFHVDLLVQSLPADGAPSEDYRHIAGFLPQPAGGAAEGQFLQVSAVDENGNVTEIVSADGTGGGGGLFLTTATVESTDDSGSTWCTADHTSEEVVAAFNAGMVCAVLYEGNIYMLQKIDGTAVQYIDFTESTAERLAIDHSGSTIEVQTINAYASTMEDFGTLTLAQMEARCIASLRCSGEALRTEFSCYIDSTEGDAIEAGLGAVLCTLFRRAGIDGESQGLIVVQTTRGDYYGETSAPGGSDDWAAVTWRAGSLTKGEKDELVQAVIEALPRAEGEVF